MSVESSIYTVLSANATVAAITSTRIYPNDAPQKAAVPFVVFQQISGNRDYAHDGASTLVEGRFQFTCIDDKYLDVRALADAVRGAISAYSETVSGAGVQRILIEAETDMPVIPAEKEQLRRYGKILDCTVWWKE